MQQNDIEDVYRTSATAFHVDGVYHFALFTGWVQALE
jgi:hypothetical protein